MAIAHATNNQNIFFLSIDFSVSGKNAIEKQMMDLRHNLVFWRENPHLDAYFYTAKWLKVIILYIEHLTKIFKDCGISESQYTKNLLCFVKKHPWLEQYLTYVGVDKNSIDNLTSNYYSNLIYKIVLCLPATFLYIISC